MELTLAALALLAAVPLVLEDNLPYVDVDVGGRAITMRLDSGAWGSGVGLTTADVEQSKVTFTGSTRWMDAQGNVLSARKFTIPEARLGALVLHDVSGHEVVFAPDYAPPRRDGQLGFAFLRNYTVVVDFGGKQMKIYEAGDTMPTECGTNIAPLEVGVAGLQSVVHTNVGTVRMLWDTAAQVTVLKPEILSIPDSRYVLGEEHELTEFTIGEVKLGSKKVHTVKTPIPGVQGLIGFDFFQQHLVCFNPSRGVVAIASSRRAKQ